MSYPVKLDVFEGPLDLLLHLVSRERVDVSQVTISTITQEYLQALRKMDRVDLEVATSFLVLAATLLELKSMRLLPRATVVDPELAALLEERDHLLHRLIEYSTFKSVASELEGMFRDNLGFQVRLADVPEELRGASPDLLEGVGVDDLAREAARGLAPRRSPPVDTTHVAPIRVSVADAIEDLIEEVGRRGTTSFEELCRRVTTRIHMVVRFLGLLELYRTEKVDLEQSEPLGEIVVRWREPLTKKASP